MSFIDYLKDTRAELRHVAWPTQTQTVVFTALVITVSVLVSVYLGLFDYLFTGVLERFVNASAGVTEQIPADTTVVSTTTDASKNPSFIISTTTK